MLRFQGDDLANVSRGFLCSLKVDFRNETIVQSSLREVRNGVCDFSDLIWLFPLQRRDGLLIHITCQGAESGSFGCVELSAQTLMDLSKHGQQVRKFPVTMTGNLEPVVLRVKIQVTADNAEVLQQQPVSDLGERYKKVFDKAKLVGNYPEGGGSASVANSTSFILGLSSHNKGATHSQENSTVLHMRRPLPLAPEDDAIVPFVYQGPPARVVSVHISVGSPVLQGSKLLSLVVEDVSNADAAIGYSSSDTLYSGGYSVADVDIVNNHQESNVEKRDLDDICWADSSAGTVSELRVSVGSILNHGDVICAIDCSLGKQQLAYLMMADEIAFKNSRKSFTLNDRFQLASEKFISCVASTNPGVSTLLECCANLERVVRDFMEITRTYGKIIISEMHLPLESKTIRPVKIGGLLGGAKYIVRGVLFKIPDGSLFDSYPDPIYVANKVQGHELKGLKGYFGWFFNRGKVGKVCVPLSALVDYKGHRLTAMTLLPIRGHETLVYGSDDASQECQVQFAVPEFTEMIREASEGLMLKPHHVVNGKSRRGEAEMSSCVDLEGHRGTDGRFYLLDFSRSFPPAFKRDRPAYDKMWPFYYMLRPEFLIRWARPLSADAFSGFQSLCSEERKEEAKANHEDVKIATEALLTTVIDNVCQALFGMRETFFSLSHKFHREGLNMRYLGLVYRRLVSVEMYQSSKHNLYKLVQAEALMRVLKRILRATLRQESGGESFLIQRAVDGLNSMFGADTTSNGTAVWVETLVGQFDFKQSHAKLVVDVFMDKSQKIGDRTFKSVVLERLCESVGIVLRSGIGPGGKFAFGIGDVDFVERVKHLDIVERARGLAEYLQGENLRTKEASEHLFRAFDIFQNAMEGSSMDSWLSVLVGNICAKISGLLTGNSSNRELRELFLERAEFYYRQAVFIDAGNGLAQFLLGNFLLKQESRVQEAEEFFLSSLDVALTTENHVLRTRVLLDLVSMLERQGRLELAEKLRTATSSFVKYRDNWKGADLSSSSSSSLVPSLDRKSPTFSMGRNRSKSSASGASPIASPSSSTLDSSIQKIVRVRNVIKNKVGEAMQRRKSPRSAANSTIEEGSTIELPPSPMASSLDHSGVQNHDDDEGGDGQEMQDLMAAVERNQKLAEAAEERLVIDSDIQENLENMAKRHTMQRSADTSGKFDWFINQKKT